MCYSQGCDQSYGGPWVWALFCILNHSISKFCFVSEASWDLSWGLIQVTCGPVLHPLQASQDGSLFTCSLAPWLLSPTCCPVPFLPIGCCLPSTRTWVIGRSTGRYSYPAASWDGAAIPALAWQCHSAFQGDWEGVRLSSTLSRNLVLLAWRMYCSFALDLGSRPIGEQEYHSTFQLCHGME
jgi:hypothetical protein